MPTVGDQLASMPLAGLSAARRMSGIGASATSGTTARAKAMRAAGQPVVNFAAGELDVGSPPSAVEAAVAAAREPKLHHYTPPAGLDDLRDAIAKRWSTDDDALARDNVVVTSGTKQALFHAVMSLVDPGDEVLLPAPYWTSYPAMIRIAGGVPVVLETSQAQEFKVVPEQLDRAVTERTKLLVFVSPSNPSGAVYAPEETEAIGRWAAQRGVAVLSDEIYDGLVYGPHVSRSVVDLVPEVRDLCVRAGGVGKTYAMTGWRVGWLAGPVPSIKTVIALQSHTASHPSNIAQAAALAVLRDGEADWLDGVRSTLTHRRETMLTGVRRMPGLECTDPGGAFYVFPSVAGLFGERIGGCEVTSSLNLADILLSKARAAVVPGEAFGAPGFLRLSYAIADDDLQTGLENVHALLSR